MQAPSDRQSWKSDTESLIKKNTMKKYVVKNYKGNIVESIKKFSKTFRNFRIVEAKEENDKLKLMCEWEWHGPNGDDYDDYRYEDIDDYIKDIEDDKFCDEIEEMLPEKSELLSNTIEAEDMDTVSDFVDFKTSDGRKWTIGSEGVVTFCEDNSKRKFLKKDGSEGGSWKTENEWAKKQLAPFFKHGLSDIEKIMKRIEDFEDEINSEWEETPKQQVDMRDWDLIAKDQRLDDSINKKYVIKNYKGNLLESLKRFSERHPNIKIVEAVAKPDSLFIVGKEKLVSEGLFDFLKMKKKEDASEQEQIKSIEASIKKYISMLALFSGEDDDPTLKAIASGNAEKMKNIVDRYEKEGINVSNDTIKRKIEEIAKREAKKALSDPRMYTVEYTSSLEK